MGEIMILTPLKMQPCYKEYLWGGTRLKTDFGKTDAPCVTAESWELADHKSGVSVVAEGPLKGKTVSELGDIDRVSYWGTQCGADRFPILVKMIDADKDLSIQVHPSDLSADTDNGEEGKTEMWYIVDCKPHSFLYFGFSEKVSQEDFLRMAQDGSICSVLNRVEVHKGDIFYILPGTIHAIGAGIVIAEIQQNSDTTFRIFDYMRRGADGRYRELHLDRAAEVLDYTPVIPEECKANNTAVFDGFTFSEMFSCRYFKAFMIDIKSSVDIASKGLSFQHLICVDGTGNISYNDMTYPLERGDSYFIPAALGQYRISGRCRILMSRI